MAAGTGEPKTEAEAPKPPSPPPPPPPRLSAAAAFEWLRGRTAFWFVLAAATYLLVWGLVYAFSLPPPRPAEVRLRSMLTPSPNREETPRIVLGGAVSWRIVSAEVKELDLIEAAPGAELTLPVASDSCRAFHPPPEACESGSVFLAPPIQAAWKKKTEFLAAHRTPGAHTTITVTRTEQ